MLLDASALVAILDDEPDAHRTAEKIQTYDGTFYYTSLVVFETVVALARKKKTALLGEHAPTPPDLLKHMEDVVTGFLAGLGAIEVPIETGTYHLALEAARTFGRATGHPARLNFGDCFAYASARALNVPLLFVGNDFALTDIKPA
jgi:ribonuclease VapC